MKKFNNFKANNIDKNKKNQIWDNITDEMHEKFINNDYPQRFYQAAKNVVAYQKMHAINFMVCFFKTHNMPKEAQEIIDLFIVSIKDDTANHRLSVNLDIKKIDSDLKKAWEDKIKELQDIRLNKISFEEALTKIDINSNYIPEDHDKKVANASKDVIKEFLLCSTKRLSEDGKSLIVRNPQNAIPALYEIYQNANQLHKNQIRADAIFGDVLKTLYLQDDIDEHIKSMIGEILGAVK